MNISGQTTVSVIAPDLKDIELSSAARFQANGNLDIRNLEIDLSSAAKATFNNITATEIEIDTSSSSSVSIEKANVNTFEADASSASKITVSKIVATKLELDASSAAKNKRGLLQRHYPLHREFKRSISQCIRHNGKECIFRGKQRRQHNTQRELRISEEKFKFRRKNQRLSTPFRFSQSTYLREADTGEKSLMTTVIHSIIISIALIINRCTYNLF